MMILPIFPPSRERNRRDPSRVNTCGWLICIGFCGLSALGGASLCRGGGAAKSLRGATGGSAQDHGESKKLPWNWGTPGKFLKKGTDSHRREEVLRRG